jgi:hypothetical protein
MKKYFVPAATVAIVFALSGCFQNPIEAAVERAAEETVERALEESGADVDLGLTGDVSLPDGWPAEIPVPDGNIVSAVAIDGTYTVMIEVSSVEVGLAGLEAIKNNGFTVSYEQEMQGFRTVGLENATNTVLYSVLTDGDVSSVTIFVGPVEG